jgi:hypothetical protein
MKLGTTWSYALTCTLALAACGKGKKDEAAGGAAARPKVVASCDQRAVPMASVPTCLEYVGSAWKATEVKARCGMEGQVFLEGACPTEGVVMSCVQEKGKPMEAVSRYYDKKEKAAQVCATIGVPL